MLFPLCDHYRYFLGGDPFNEKNYMPTFQFNYACYEECMGWNILVEQSLHIYLRCWEERTKGALEFCDISGFLHDKTKKDALE